MLAVSALLSLAALAGVQSAPTWTPRWNTVKECVTDIQIVSCQDFNCGLEGYHRIDSFLTLSENTTSECPGWTTQSAESVIRHGVEADLP